MRQIGTVPSEREAQRLVDVLLTQGIQSQAEPGDTGWAVWVHDEDRVVAGRALLERFRTNPDDPEFVAMSAAADRIRAEAIAREKQAQKNIIDVRSQWTSAGARGTPITYLLIAISVGVGFMTNFGQQGGEESLLERLYFFSSRAELDRGEYWRVITPIFVHLSPMHLLFNMLALHAEGGLIEARRGSGRLLALVLFLAVTSNTAQFLWAGPGFGGMSGVIFGLFGYAWTKSRLDPGAGIHMSSQNVTMMLFWLFLCMTGAIGSIANGAHVAGLVGGIVVALVSLLLR